MSANWEVIAVYGFISAACLLCAYYLIRRTYQTVKPGLAWLGRVLRKPLGTTVGVALILGSAGAGWYFVSEARTTPEECIVERMGDAHTKAAYRQLSWYCYSRYGKK